MEAIFLPGFTTLDRANKISGRGIGLDVVKNEIETLFLYYWFTLNQSFIESLGIGSTVKGIVLSQLNGIKIRLMDYKEQCLISNRLSVLDTKIRKEKAFRKNGRIRYCDAFRK